ncbi:hypothetical protein IOD16_33185 [Saccharothrix sp. 6-C]|uniref:hypothetical protein n=1 Tax=Saccharothrix sp. 6-C TaxID=2781735 RepID=UPI0019178F5B|nr:hypothetical protein [Saccharothrix sp. 6-C]QQQ75868.1 hypothetical protein IOD16_33185 [Saccharothrix sp. 6-C]
MDIGEPERSGRHRLEDGAAIWLPMGGELDHTPLDRAVARPAPAPPPRPAPPPPRAPRPPAPPPEPPPPDPFVDTDAMGLRKFNIGLVPASVTPPRTWKRAAWFTVLSSAGVLVGLAVVASNLVGTNGPAERIALPGYPTGVPLLTGFPPPPPPPTSSTARHVPAAAVVDELSPAGGDRAAAAGSAPDDPVAGPVVDPAPETSAVVTAVPSESAPVVDADTLAMSTELFYEEVAANSDGALTLVSEAFRIAGDVLDLEREFADVSLIEVLEISVDPTRGVTVSTLGVTHEDGSRTTEKRELVFTTTGTPLIDGERPAGGA